MLFQSAKHQLRKSRKDCGSLSLLSSDRIPGDSDRVGIYNLIVR